MVEQAVLFMVAVSLPLLLVCWCGRLAKRDDHPNDPVAFLKSL